MTITKDMNLGQVVNDYPQTAEIFQEYGMHCLGCAISHFETIEDGVNAHGIDLDAIMTALNAAVSA